MIGLSPLARFATARDSSAPAPGGRCELCSGALPAEHRHVVEIGQPGLQCVCQPCAILFGRDHSDGRFRTVPDRVGVDRAFGLSPQRLAELGIPVAIAFCYFDSARACGIVCYPGPAGITEAELDAEVWDAITGATVLAKGLAEDVEVLLVHGGRGVTTLTCYLAPISAAYELAGRLRSCWQGFSGGEQADRELAAFFADLDHRGGGR